MYQTLFIQARGSARELLVSGLRAQPSRSRATRVALDAIHGRQWTTEEVRTSPRPAEPADWAVPGHWEIDLLIGAGSRTAILTLVERHTRYVRLGALPTDPEIVAVIRGLFADLPRHLRASLKKRGPVDLPPYGLVEDCPVYFANPDHPWLPGANESTSGLLRQYFPKDVFDFARTTQAELDEVAAELNGRPRMTLQWRNPAEQLTTLLAASTVA